MPYSERHKLRVCNVSHLDSICYRFLGTIPWIDYSECHPAECARRLLEDECDLGLLPIAEFLAHGQWAGLRFGITANGPVESVLMLSEEPVDNLSRILVDTSSLTSATLLRILLSDFFPQAAPHITFTRESPDRIPNLIRGNCGGLLIGDVALQNRRRFHYRLDLAEAWQLHTGHPFVFAVWAGNPDRIDPETSARLETAFLEELSHIELFARDWADANRLDREFAVRYVTERIRYRLDPSALRGALEFARRGCEHGFFPASAPGAAHVLPETDRTGSVPPDIILAGRTHRSIDAILSDAGAGRRLSTHDALRLSREASLADLSLAADSRRIDLAKQHPQLAVEHAQIVLTNISCTNSDPFGFSTTPGQSDGFVLSREQVATAIQTLPAKETQRVSLLSGTNPELSLGYFEDFIGWVKSQFRLELCALSAEEVLYYSEAGSTHCEEALNRLISAGLDLLGGSSLRLLLRRFQPRHQQRTGSEEDWLRVHRTSHRLGLRSLCSMRIDVGETWKERLVHLYRLRHVQDETSGFAAFLCEPAARMNRMFEPQFSATEFLRTVAVTRLFLDNFPAIESSAIGFGTPLAELSLSFGATSFPIRL